MMVISFLIGDLSNYFRRAIVRLIFCDFWQDFVTLLKIQSYEKSSFTDFYFGGVSERYGTVLYCAESLKCYSSIQQNCGTTRDYTAEG